MIGKFTQIFFKEQKYRDLVTLLSLGTSLSAFAFQITILYPWHIQLTKEFDSLSKKIIDKN